MQIEARLFATLRENRGKTVFLAYNPGVRVADVVAELKIDPNDIAILLVNGRDGSLDQVVEDGDVISLFPPVGGG